MSEHTKGPWVYGHAFDPNHECNCTSILSDYRLGSICEITIDNGKRIGDGGNDGPPLEEAACNARLIAAAPDLLEAAESLRNAQKAYMVDRGNDSLGKIVGQKAKELDAAIAKARGQQ